MADRIMGITNVGSLPQVSQTASSGGGGYYSGGGGYYSGGTSYSSGGGGYSSGGGGSSSGGGGGGGGGSDDGPSDEQKEAAANLGGIVGYNADTLRQAYDNAMKVYDVSDQQNEYLRDLQLKQSRRKAGSDWYAQYQNLQSTVGALADRAGNATRGSFLYDLRDAIARVDDQQDAETLNTMRENNQSVRNSYFEALAATNNSRNDLAQQTESNLRELGADYAAQLNNIHPDLAADVIDAEGHTLNMPDWLDTEFFDDHLREAVKPEDELFYRPDRANSTAWDKGLLTGDQNTASAANADYWQRLNSGYDNRNRNA